MKNKFLFLILLQFVLFSHSALSDKTTLNPVKYFNNIVKMDGRNEKGEPESVSLHLLCGTVKEVISIDGNEDKPLPILSVDEHGLKLKPVMHGGKWPDGMDFEKMNDRNIIGFEYYYKAPNGYITVTAMNNGKVTTEIQVTSGKKEKSKSSCIIVN